MMVISDAASSLLASVSGTGTPGNGSTRLADPTSGVGKMGVAATVSVFFHHVTFSKRN